MEETASAECRGGGMQERVNRMWLAFFVWPGGDSGNQWVAMATGGRRIRDEAASKLELEGSREGQRPGQERRRGLSFLA